LSLLISIRNSLSTDGVSVYMRTCGLCPVLVLTCAALVACTHGPEPVLFKSLPVPPAQPIEEALSCERMAKFTMHDVSGKWMVTVSDGGCTFPSAAPRAVQATASEMAALTNRPHVRFELTPTGEIRSASIALSSGSRALDQKALGEVVSHRYPRNTCGICRVTTVVNVEFGGPVWIRDIGR
jgi:TonB family protein